MQMLNKWLEDLSLIKVFLCLLLLGFITYSSAINNPFVHDDIVFIQNNPNIGKIDLNQFFVSGKDAADEGRLINSYYRPLLDVFNSVVSRLSGQSPKWFHIANIIIHIFNSFLVFLLIELLFRNRKGISFICAVGFLVHPVQSEAVACVSGISNILFSFFLLLSLVLYLSSDKDRPYCFVKYVLSCIFFVLALLSKEQAIMLPFLIGAIMMGSKVMSLKNGKMSRLIPYVFIAVSYFILRRIIFGTTVARFSGYTWELLLRVAAIPKTILIYLRIIVFPSDLHYYRSLDVLQPMLLPSVIFLFVFVVLFFMIRKMSSDNKHMAIIGVIWFFVLLLPVLNIVPMINEYSFILIAEHFLYLPILGVILVLVSMYNEFLVNNEIVGGDAIQGVGNTDNVQNITRTTAVSYRFLYILLIMLVFLTFKQNMFWRGEIPLFERTLVFEKDFGRVHILLAKAYYSDGRFEDAIVEDKKAVDIMQGYVDKTENAQAKEAYENYKKEAYVDMAYSYVALKSYDNAISIYKKIISIDGSNASVHNNLAVVFMNIGQKNKAIKHFKRAVMLDQNNTMFLRNFKEASK